MSSSSRRIPTRRSCRRDRSNRRPPVNGERRPWRKLRTERSASMGTRGLGVQRACDRRGGAPAPRASSRITAAGACALSTDRRVGGAAVHDHGASREYAARTVLAPVGCARRGVRGVGADRRAHRVPARLALGVAQRDTPRAGVGLREPRSPHHRAARRCGRGARVASPPVRAQIRVQHGALRARSLRGARRVRSHRRPALRTRSDTLGRRNRRHDRRGHRERRHGQRCDLGEPEPHRRESAPRRCQRRLRGRDLQRVRGARGGHRAVGGRTRCAPTDRHWNRAVCRLSRVRVSPPAAREPGAPVRVHPGGP